MKSRTEPFPLSSLLIPDERKKPVVRSLYSPNNEQVNRIDPVAFSQSSLSYNPCREIFDLASTIYPADVVLPPQILLRWYSANSEIFFVALVDGKLVGYISLLPLTERKFMELYSPDFDETSITSEDILPFSESRHFFRSSTVVHPDYRSGPFAVSRLLRINILSELLVQCKKAETQNKGKKFGTVTVKMASEAITVKGEYMAQSMGQTFVAETGPGKKLFVGEFTSVDLQRCIDALHAKLPDSSQT
jgi:GNAT superfamily N-acetyltransferase